MEVFGRKKSKAEAAKQKRIGEKLAQKRVKQHYQRYGPPPAKKTGNPLTDLKQSTERLRASSEHSKAKTEEAIKSSKERLGRIKAKGLLDRARKIGKAASKVGKFGVVGRVGQVVDEAKRMKRTKDLKKKVREGKPIQL